MRLTSTLVLCLCHFACGGPFDAPNGVLTGTVDSYLQTFLDEGGINAGLIPVFFVNMEKPTVGRCIYYNNSNKYIELDPTYWADASEITRLTIAEHESAHCLLRRGHDTDTFIEIDDFGIERQYPRSIMYPNILSDYVATRFRKRYLLDLFSGGF